MHKLFDKFQAKKRRDRKVINQNKTCIKLRKYAVVRGYSGEKESVNYGNPGGTDEKTRKNACKNSEKEKVLKCHKMIRMFWNKKYNLHCKKGKCKDPRNSVTRTEFTKQIFWKMMRK